MNIEVVTENSYARKVVVTVPASDVRSELDRAYRTYEKRARLPGFRRGRVPRKVLEARFGPGIAAEVAEQLVQKGWRTVLQDHGIEPVGQPALTDRGDVVASADFTFTIAVEVKPEVEVGTYKGLKAQWPDFEVGDDMVDMSVEQRRQQQSRLAAVDDRAVEMGDTVQVQLAVTDGDDTVLEEPGTLVRTAGEVWLKGLEGFLVGMGIDEEKAGEGTFAEDAKNEDVAGRTLQVAAKVRSIQALSVPELDDALAKEMGHDSVAALKDAVRSELEAGRDEQARNQARANLLQSLIDANPIDVPNGMVEQNLEMLKQELRYQAAYRGQDPRSLQFSDEQLADLRQRATFAARGALLLEGVWTAESIAVDDAELDARIAEMAEQRGQTVEAVKGWLAQDGGLEDFRQRILEEKTLDWLLEHAEIEKIDPAAQVEAAVEAASEPVAEEAKPAKKAKKAKAPKKAEAEATEAGGADLSVLGGAIKDLKAALATGDHDAHLDALLAAEEAGRNRKGAVAAIKSRMG